MDKLRNVILSLVLIFSFSSVSHCEDGDDDWDSEFQNDWGDDDENVSEDSSGGDDEWDWGENKKPIAVAGDNRIVYIKSEVSFDASNSYDEDGYIEEYEWSENGVVLSEKKSFTKTDFAEGIHDIQLKIMDDMGEEAVDNVRVIVSGPIANAGADQVIDDGVIRLLDHSGSFGKNLEYSWSSKDFNLDKYKKNESGNLLFYPAQPGTYTFELNVSDSKTIHYLKEGIEYQRILFSTDIVTVTVTKARETNLKAIINSNKQTKDWDDDFILDASQSSDPNSEIVSYEWYVIDKDGKENILSNQKIMTTYKYNSNNIVLRVKNDKGEIDENVIKLFYNYSGTVESLRDIGNIENIIGSELAKPIANAKSNKNSVTEGESVVFDGSKSSDSNGRIVKYSWSDGGNSLGEGKTLTTDKLAIGERSITLKVIDDDGDSNSDTIKIRVKEKANKPPIANAGADKTITLGSSVQLNASSSRDDDGNIVKYEWSEDGNSLGEGKTLTLNNLPIGNHTIRLMVKDNQGGINKDGVNIKVIQSTKDLSVIVNGDGGRVYSDGEIDCGFGNNQCKKSLLTSSINLFAEVKDGYIFKGWGGDCSGTDTTCKLNMNSHKNISATFKKKIIKESKLVVVDDSDDSTNANLYYNDILNFNKLDCKLDDLTPRNLLDNINIDGINFNQIAYLPGSDLSGGESISIKIDGAGIVPNNENMLYLLARGSDNTLHKVGRLKAFSKRDDNSFDIAIFSILKTISIESELYISTDEKSVIKPKFIIDSSCDKNVELKVSEAYDFEDDNIPHLVTKPLKLSKVGKIIPKSTMESQINISKNSEKEILDIPQYTNNINISVKSDDDVDIRLIDKDNNIEIVSYPNGLLGGKNGGANPNSIVYNDEIKIKYSGYNGIGSKLGYEYITIDNSSDYNFKVMIYSYKKDTNATIDYQWDKSTN